MIEVEMKSEKGQLAAQFLMGQKQIKAMGEQARSENLFLVRQDLADVS